MTGIPPGSGLTQLEIASGLLFGVEKMATSPATPAVSARAALEAAVLPALRRPPCVVSFSGGLDSSAVLATASSVARREGLPAPVAVTLRFPAIEEADETSWQEAVVAGVPVDDWVRVEIGAELSVVGPVARAVLCEHGLLWPFNAYVHVPVLEQARGGSVLTGFGGDEVFARSRWDRLAAVAAGRARPGARDLRRAVLPLLPASVRAHRLRRRCPLLLPWLSAAAHAELERAWASEAASEPFLAGARGRWRLRLRSLRTTQASLRALAAARDVTIAHPLADTAVVAAVARVREPGAGRGETLHAILGELLPPELYARRTKASFNAAFWGEDARELAAAWTGEGVDGSLVEHEAVRAAWGAAVPDGRAFTLLQSAWLSREATRAGGGSPAPGSPTTAGAGRRPPAGPPAEAAPADRSAGA